MPNKICLLLLLFIGNFFFSFAQSKKSISTRKISETIALDGELNEEAWKNISSFEKRLNNYNKATTKNYTET
jgi:hypothetical protein